MPGAADGRGRWLLKMLAGENIGLGYARLPYGSVKVVGTAGTIAGWLDTTLIRSTSGSPS